MSPISLRSIRGSKPLKPFAKNCPEYLHGDESNTFRSKNTGHNTFKTINTTKIK